MRDSETGSCCDRFRIADYHASRITYTTMEPTVKNKEATNGDDASEVERLKEEVRREHEMYLRALADFDNYRRRVERERAGAARSGKRDLIISLLDVIDNFDRALEHIGDAPSSVSKGVQAIHRKLIGLLEAQ